MCYNGINNGGDITSASCKQKGRKLQQLVAAKLLEVGSPYGLEEDDIKSVSMGVNGNDIVLSPAARKVFHLSIECKNVEALSVPKTFWDHYNKYKNDSSLKLLIHSKNRHTPLVSMRMEDFMELLGKTIDTGKSKENRQIQEAS